MSDAARAEAYLSNLDAENSALEEEEPPKKAAGITLAEMTARAEAIVNYAWTPSQNITTWNSNKYNGLTYFPAGQTVKGMPYTLFTSEVVSQSLCSLERYKTLASSNYSATKYCNSVGATRTGPVYGSCCADLVCEVFGGNFMSGSSPRYHSVTYIKNSSYGTTTSNVPISQLRPGDAVSDTAVTHILWIGAVTDTQITFYEQTPPIARKVTVNKASCTNSNGYFVYGGHVYNIVTRSNEFVNTPTEAPMSPWIKTDVKKVAINEEITFTYGATGSIEGYAVGIDKVGVGRIETLYPGTYGTWSMSFSEAGEYTAYVTAFNSVGGADSEKIIFIVYDSVPKVATITTDKRKYAIYENIFISVKSDTANGYAIGLDICNANGEIIERLNTILIGDRYEPYDIGILPAGYYSVYATAFNNYGGIDSEKIWFTVYESAPVWAKTVTDKKYYDVGEKVKVTASSDTAINYSMGLDLCDPAGEKVQRIDTIDLVDRYESYDVESLPAGYYSVYVTAINHYGWIDSPKAFFCVGHKVTYDIEEYPTPESTGSIKGTCAYCPNGEAIVLPKLNTTDYTKTTTKAATCTEGGTDSYKWKTTTYGTFTFTVATSAKGHTSVTDKAVAATCTAAGKTEGSHCSVCNAVIKAQTTVAALGHSYTSKVTAPTCTAQGYTTYTCSRCSNSYKDSYTNATGHSYTYKATKNPTTSATGTLTGTCSKCSGTTTVTLPKLNTTDYTKTTTKSATCTEGGTDSYKWKTTTYGTFTFTVATSAKGHTSVTDKAVAATCTATGLTEGSHCSVCNAVIKAQTTVAALGHSYTSKVTAPTCTAQGYTTYTCSRCSNSYKDSYTNATGHSDTYKATTNPTTSATGVLTGTCSKCSGTTTVTLPKLNTTDYTKTTTKSATCTEGGTDSYKWKTTTYGTFTFTVATSAKGHTSVTDKAVAATCTATGLTEGSHCSVCNAVIKAQTTVAALGHNYSSKVTAPTCTAQGYTTYTCSRCSNSYKDSYTNATGHSYTYKATKNPTTSATGTLTGTCSKCSGTTTVTLPKLNTTDYTKTTTKSATCTEGGTDSYKWKTTTYGTFTFTVATSAKGHTSVTDKAVAATCTAAGKTEGSHCSVCNAVIKAQTTVAALGHNYSSKVTAPTCTAQGYTTYTCSRCSNSYKDSYTNATGHSYTYKATTNPTTSATGVLTGTCSKCSGTTTVTLPKLNTTDYTKTTTKSATCTEGGTDSYKWKTTTYGTFTFTVATSAKGHTSVTDKAVAATCTATGLTEGSHCSVCNAVIKAQTTVAALGHNYSSKITAPTCTAQGYTTYTCSRCADSYKDTYTDAIGHNYTYTDCGETHEGVCENCSNKVTESHNYSDGNCICGAIEITAPITDTAITISHSLNLASDISINYAVKASLLTNYDSFYLEVQRPVYNGNAMTGFKTIKIDPVLTGNYYYFTMNDITAVNMNDELVAILHMTKGKQEYISKTDSYSIVTYALNQLNKDTAADKLKTLCADLLRYGAAAQNFKGYRTDAGATVPMTDANRAWFSDINAVTFGNTNMVHNDLTNPLITWAGKTLNLESKVVVKFIFNAGAYTGNISNLTLRMVYCDNSGIYRTVTLTDPAVYNEAKRQYAFEFDGLLAAELRTALSVAVYSGDVQLSPTLQYSPDTYGNNKTGNLGELCKALFAYSDSAKAYFS